jgi:ribose 5-phosphate isomerase B
MGERVPIGADHAGFELKERLKAELAKRGLEPLDVGAHSTESVDYPDFAKGVAAKVSAGEVRRGVLMCGTGLGMSYAASRAFPSPQRCEYLDLAVTLHQPGRGC